MKSEKKAKTVQYREEEKLPPRKCMLFLIEGKVQGVWFRESTRRQAQPLGITGYAKNMADGSVQVLACGEEGALDRLAAWLKKGPSISNLNTIFPDNPKY